MEISMVGFKGISLPVIIIDDLDINLDFTLEETVLNTEQVIVTANKYNSRIQDLPVSAEIITTNNISSKNITRIDDALRYVPGVNVILDQVSIRGSSGYSRGAGTRVLVAVDGLPMYSGDSGEIVWQMIPPTEISRVEIIKGAASSLYGSTAIGGVINILTRKNSNQPVTYIRTYGGVYDNPAHNEWKWWNKSRFFNGLNISHSNSYQNLSFTISLGRTEDMSYKQGDWSKKFFGFLKAEYDFSQTTSLTLLSNGYTQEYGTFNYWENIHNALIPPDEDQNQQLPSQRLLTGLILKQIIDDNFSLTARLSHVYGNWEDNSLSSNHSRSNLLREEIQLLWETSGNLMLVSGIESSQGFVSSNIFGNPSSMSYGFYTQADFEIIKDLKITAGLRADFNRLKKGTNYSINTTSLIDFSSFNSKGFKTAVSPKFGINYKILPNTSLRFMAAKGFRAPSLSETFTSTSTGSITVLPNPDLKAESNISIETGIKQKLNENWSLDAAFFNNEYYDMIEPALDTRLLNIQFINVIRARIQGVEIINSLKLKPLNTDVQLGYTYLNTKDISTGKQLKYRPKHMMYISAEYNIDIYQFGADFRYWSRVEEIDDDLVRFNIVPDGDKRVEVFVLDLNAGVNLFEYDIPLKAYLNLKNALNYSYVEMIGNFGPIRNISLNLESAF